MPAILLDRLALLATNLLAGVTHAFAFVRLRRIEPPNVRGDLADRFLVYATDRNLCVLRDADFDVFWNRKQDRVRKSEAEIQGLTLHRGPETDTFNFQLFA